MDEKFQDRIDDYLLNSMNVDEKESFLHEIEQDADKKSNLSLPEMLKPQSAAVRRSYGHWLSSNKSMKGNEKQEKCVLQVQVKYAIVLLHRLKKEIYSQKRKYGCGFLV